MTPNRHILKIPPFLMGLIAIFTMAACGSYEYSGYDRDGIYGSNNGTYTIEPNEVQPQTKQVTEADDTGYYENYFGQEAKEIERARNMIFTDVDSYSSNEPDSTYNEEEMYLDEGIAYNSGNATWGSNPTEININYYDTGYGSPYYGGWSNFAWGYGYAGNSFYFGWRNPYNAYYNPYYNPFYNPYTYNPYYGYGGYYGYNNPYYYGYGYAPYYYNGYYNPYYTRVVQHRNYRNVNRSSYDRPDARNRSRTSATNSRGVRSQNNDGRTNRSSVNRIRNPRRVNASDSRRDNAQRSSTRTRTETRTRRSNSRSNDRATRSTRSSRNDHARSSRSRRSNDNSARRSTRSSSNNSRSSVRSSTRSYSPPARSTSSRSSGRGSSRRGGR